MENTCQNVVLKTSKGYKRVKRSLPSPTIFVNSNLHSALKGHDVGTRGNVGEQAVRHVLRGVVCSDFPFTLVSVPAWGVRRRAIVVVLVAVVALETIHRHDTSNWELPRTRTTPPHPRKKFPLQAITVPRFRCGLKLAGRGQHCIAVGAHNLAKRTIGKLALTDLVHTLVIGCCIFSFSAVGVILGKGVLICRFLWRL